MRITWLEWDDYRLEHVAEHDVESDEVWEVCGKSWIYHDVRMVVPALDARPVEQMAMLEEIITSHYADLQEQSEVQHTRLKRKSGIDLPGVKPASSLSTTDLGHKSLPRIYSCPRAKQVALAAT